MATQQAIQTGPPKKLLSCDGGGVKGLSSLIILREIMRKVQELEDGPAATTEQTKPGIVVTSATQMVDERKPIDYFDLTGGTSTGGIIAVMLGRLGLTCSEAIECYKQLAEEIFSIRLFGINISTNPILSWLGPFILDIKTLFGTQFGSKYLNAATDNILAKYLPKHDPLGPDGEPLLVADRYKNHDARGKMLMCATMASRGKALLFRDYTPPPDAIPEAGEDDPDHQATQSEPENPYAHARWWQKARNTKKLLRDFDYNCVTIKEAVRATSAAPTYLPPEVIQNIQFWDGGMLNNNPIDQVWAARYDLAPNCHTEPYVSTVVSLGCTWSTPSDKTPTGLLGRLIGILNKSLDFMTNTEAKHMDFKRNMHRRNLRQPKDQQTKYFRFNAPIGDKKVDLADFKAMPFLEKITHKFLEDSKVQGLICECAEQLVKHRRS